MKTLTKSLILSIAFIATVSAGSNQKENDDHGHAHGPNGEHGGHEYDAQHSQETFEVNAEKMLDRSKHQHDGQPHAHKANEKHDAEHKHEEHQHDGEHKCEERQHDGEHKHEKHQHDDEKKD